MLIEGQITPGHARSILVVRDPEALAKRVVEKGLTVRDVEAIAHAEHANGSERRERRRVEKDPDTRALERALEDVLGLTVAIEHRGSGGELRIRYKTLEQLDGLCRRLNETAPQR
jgi:ParB family chromosome partitioning protein